MATFKHGRGTLYHLVDGQPALVPVNIKKTGIAFDQLVRHTSGTHGVFWMRACIIPRQRHHLAMGSETLKKWVSSKPLKR